MNAIFATVLSTVAQVNDSFDAPRLHTSIMPVIPTASVKPGDIVDAQLGNSFDSYWTPKAQMLVLRVREGICNTVIVDGICKRDDGVIAVKLDAIQYNLGEVFKSTRSLYEVEMKPYLSPETYGELTRLMSLYADEIEALEGYTEIHKPRSAPEVNFKPAC